jgi:hypothetical protein
VSDRRVQYTNKYNKSDRIAVHRRERARVADVNATIIRVFRIDVLQVTHRKLVPSATIQTKKTEISPQPAEEVATTLATSTLLCRTVQCDDLRARARIRHTRVSDDTEPRVMRLNVA